MKTHWEPFYNESSKESSISTGYISGSGVPGILQPASQENLPENKKLHFAGPIAMMINGVLAIVFGIVWINLKCEISESGIPVWAGLWFVATGILGIATLKTLDSKCLVKSYIVFSSIDILLGFNLVIIGGVSAATEKAIYDAYALRVTIDSTLVIWGFTGCLIALGCILSISSFACSACLIDKEIRSADGSYLSVIVDSRSGNSLEQNYKVFLPLNETQCKRSSIGQLVCGICSLGFGIGWMVLYCLYSETGSALFCGVFFVLTGCLGYFATKKPYNTCLLITYTVFCALCILYAGGVLGVVITAAVKEPEVHKTSQGIRITFDVILAVVNLLEISLAVWSIVVVSDVVCGSCSSSTKLPYEAHSRGNNSQREGTQSTTSSSVFVVREIEKPVSTPSTSGISSQASP